MDVGEIEEIVGTGLFTVKVLLVAGVNAGPLPPDFVAVILTPVSALLYVIPVKVTVVPPLGILSDSVPPNVPVPDAEIFYAVQMLG